MTVMPHIDDAPLENAASLSDAKIISILRVDNKALEEGQDLLQAEIDLRDSVLVDLRNTNRYNERRISALLRVQNTMILHAAHDTEMIALLHRMIRSLKSDDGGEEE
jgi:hypothetical protein